MRHKIPHSFERVIRKFVKIDCQKCSYPRGVKNEHGITKCGMCGKIQNEEKNAMV